MTSPPTIELPHVELPYRLLGQIETGSDEWHAVRAHRIGGSEIAAVLGLSPYESPLSLWYRKAGLVGPADMNAEMKWGQRLEDDVKDAFFEAHPEARPIGGGVFVNNERPWQLASPDERLAIFDSSGRIADHEILETKTSPYGEGWGTGPADIPVYVKAQCQWYLDVFGWKRARIAVLISGYDYREYVYESDPDEAQFLRDAAAAFVWSLDNDVRPDIDGHEQTYRAIQARHPKIDGERIDVGAELGEAFIRARIAESDAATEFQRQRSLLADAMGEAQSAYWGAVKLADRRAKSPEATPYVQANGEKALRAGLVKHSTIRDAVLAKRDAEAAAAPTLTIAPTLTEGAVA